MCVCLWPLCWHYGFVFLIVPPFHWAEFQCQQTLHFGVCAHRCKDSFGPRLLRPTTYEHWWWPFVSWRTHPWHSYSQSHILHSWQNTLNICPISQLCVPVPLIATIFEPPTHLPTDWLMSHFCKHTHFTSCPYQTLANKYSKYANTNPAFPSFNSPLIKLGFNSAVSWKNLHIFNLPTR